MTDTYYTHNIKTGDKKEFIKFMTTHMNKSGYLSEPINIDEHNVDKIISKQLLIHLRDFFKSKNKTKRVKRNRKNRTVKL
jgi:hypothetical protein